MNDAKALSKLNWETDAGYQMATDGDCLYIRESPSSRLAGLIFCLILVVTGLGGAIWAFSQPQGDSWIFGIFAAVLSLVFLLVAFSSVRQGPWMIVYDRGVGEIRYRNKILKAESVTFLTVREVGTGSQSMSNRIVFAELRNGPAEALGPTGPIMSAQRWAKAAAEWMGLEYKF